MLLSTKLEIRGNNTAAQRIKQTISCIFIRNKIEYT
jgi:hypothetical protein